jgi:hypothetical protein
MCHICIVYVYPTTYLNMKIMVRDWRIPHQVIFVKEKMFSCGIYVYPTYILP